METPLRILVAENELNDVLLLQKAFDWAGVKKPIHFARNGPEVIDYLEGHPPFDNPVQYPLPNLLLLDLKLPRLDSIEVLTWIRAHSRLHRLTVVVLTGSDNPEDVERVYAAGANACVIKPHAPDELVHIVRRLQSYWLAIDAVASDATSAQALLGILGDFATAFHPVDRL